MIATLEPEPCVLKFPTVTDAAAPINPASRITLRSYYNQVLLNEIKVDQEESSLKEDRIALNHWERSVGDIDIREVDKSTLVELRDALLSAGLSDATVNKTWRELRPIFEAAVYNGLIGSAPSIARKMRSKLVRKERKKRQREIITMEELPLLWNACSNATYPANKPGIPPAPLLWRVAIVLFWNYGMRTRDLLNLQWSDIDFRNRIITFEAQKTGKIQGLPMTANVRSHLESIHRANARQVFPGFNSRGCYLSKQRRWKAGYYATWRREILADNPALHGFQFKNFRQRVVNDYNAMMDSIKLGSWIAGHSLQGVSAVNYENPTRQIREAIESAPVPDCFLQIG